MSKSFADGQGSFVAVAVAYLGRLHTQPRYFFKLMARPMPVDLTLGRVILDYLEHLLIDQTRGYSASVSAIACVYLLQARLCDQLEQVADHLPRVNVEMITKVSEALKLQLPQLMDFEDKRILPAVAGTRALGSSEWHLIEQIEREHDEDRFSAQELQDLLEDLHTLEGQVNPDLAGYRIRAFFLALSRHVQWECHFILPIVQDQMSESDVHDLQEKLPKRISQWMAR